MSEEEEIEHSNILDTNKSLIQKGLANLEINNVFSPLVVHKLLSVLYQDHRYRHSNNFKSLITYNNDLFVKCFQDFASYLHSLKTSLSLASKLFINNNYEMQDELKDLLNNFHYNTEITEFHEHETTVINKWIEEQTKGTIRELTSSDSLSDKTCLALLNSACLKGKWVKEFILEPAPMTFYLNENDNIQIQMMTLRGNVNCIFEEDYQIVQLPFNFDDSEVSAFVVLPNREHKLKDLGNIVRNLQDCEAEIVNKEVEILLPKFKLDTVMNCEQFFQNLGLEEEFKDNMILFGMLKNEELLKYSHFDAKGFLNVDEKGVEIASGIETIMERTEFEEEILTDGLKMLEMDIKTEISNRFAKTFVTSKIQNTNESAKDASFSMVLPEAAFITEFAMEMNGKIYKSFIKKREEAKAIYDEALALGKSAGIVETDIRDSTEFKVSVNLEPQAVAVFLLTYEEMLQRVCDQYDLVLNICPGRIVNNLNVEVNINESKPLKFVKTPPLRSGKEIDHKIEKYLIPSGDIKMVNSNTAIVKFKPDILQQWKTSIFMGTEGFAGQFVVQYDVERDPKDGEILVQDGYFVHFFAPKNLEPLPKHIIFVLDTSTSMRHLKIEQLKNATMAILNDLRKGDLISIIEFNKDIIVWNINTGESKKISCDSFKNFAEPFETFSELALPSPAVVDDDTISKAKSVVQKISCNGNTFMIGGLETALYMLKVEQEKNSEHQPVMVFLTDGEPNIGVDAPSKIVELVTSLNSFYNKVPIFSLSFGERADKSFLRLLSFKNFGFSKHIYEASDAFLQLQLFYKQISSPLLANIKFYYDSDVTEVTKNHFPIYFKGGELVVSGQCKGGQLSSTINGYGPKGLLQLASIVQNPVTSVKRLWAYLTVKQLLEERAVVTDKEELTKRASALALKYSFVTEVTSLVVVKPDEICDTTGPQSPPDENLEDTTCDFRSYFKRKGRGYRFEGPEEVKVKPSDKFMVDHPFLIALMLKRGHKRIFLFGGWIHNPSIDLKYF